MPLVLPPRRPALTSKKSLWQVDHVCGRSPEDTIGGQRGIKLAAVLLEHPSQHLRVQRVSNYTWPAAPLFHFFTLPSLMRPCASRTHPRAPRRPRAGQRRPTPSALRCARARRPPASPPSPRPLRAASAAWRPQRPPSCGGRRGSCCAFPWSLRRLWKLDYPHGTGGERLCGRRAAGSSGAGAVGGAVERVADRSPTVVVWSCMCVDRHV